MAQWNKNLVTSRRLEVRTRVRALLFYKKFGECGEKKNFTAKKCKSYKVHRLKPQILQKVTAFNAFNAKRCRRFVVKKFFCTAIHR